MPGKASSAWITAHDTRCVKETFDSSAAARSALISRRFSSSSLIGIWRCVVAVGTSRLRSMFSAIRAAAPRIGRRSPSIGAVGTDRPAEAAADRPAEAATGCPAGAATGAAGDPSRGAGVAGGSGARAGSASARAPAPPGPNRSWKNRRHSSSTEAGFAR